MTTRIRVIGEVPATQVAGTFNTGDTSLSIVSASGQPAVFPSEYVISRTVPALRERIRVGGRTGTTFNTITRAIDGTTAKLHSVGETVELCVTGSNLDELNQLLGGTTGDIFYNDGTNVAHLGIGASNDVLRVTGGLPDWQSLTSLIDAALGGTANQQQLTRASGAWAASFFGIPVFADATARDSAIGSPAAGMAVYLDTGTALEGLYFHNGTSWRQVAWNAPWGEFAYAEKTSSQATISAITDITSLTTGSVTLVLRRRYKTTLHLPVLSQVTTAGFQTATLADAGNTQLAICQQLQPAGNDGWMQVVNIETGVAGAATRKGRIQVSAGTVTVAASATNRPFILMEDIGPAAGAPA